MLTVCALLGGVVPDTEAPALAGTCKGAGGQVRVAAPKASRDQEPKKGRGLED
jgi:hypothetical protein